MKTFLMICLVSFATTGAALADAGLSESGSRDLSGAIGQPLGNLSGVVGVSVAMPLVASGAGGEALFEVSADQFDFENHKSGKRLPLAKDVFVPAPGAALAKRSQEN
ncbi:MAG: hypothetical protein Q7S99_07205 [Parvibaculum sp.]|nr:hypothetical protein [Parvibaculum sp.]|tara:strand:+ start:4018 stop:4338 length:321 start_codon:yes stop_codon:yes gene_type:complete